MGDPIMGPFDNSVGAVAFWLFVGAVSVAGSIMPYLRHRETQRTIRAAIDKGQPIDPALLTEPKKNDKPESYILFGLVLLAAGVGLQVLAVCIAMPWHAGTVWSINGAGAICLLIGLALIGYGRWQMKRRG
jgi:hypothetical protein